MKRFASILLLFAASFVRADTAVVDGVEWTYGVDPSTGSAWVGSLDGLSTAIPDSTAGGIRIPDHLDGHPVKAIADYAFANCSGLTSVVIPNGVTTIGQWAFWRCSALGAVEIPVSVTTIGQCAFDDCSSLSSVTIPDGVTTIGQGAFYGCSSLRSIAIPDGVTIIEEVAFYDCSSLTSVAIPDSVTIISHEAFGGCSLLTSITIPNGVTSIGWQAFYECSSLASVSIPDSVTEIWDQAFYGCPARLFDTTSVPGVKLVDGWAVGYTSSLSGHLNSPKIRGIAGAAFSGCSRLSSVVIPAGMTSVGWDTFSGCSGLTSITIPAGVKNVGGRAFSGCSGLASVAIPDSVTGIGSSAFEGCSADLFDTTSVPGVKLVDGWVVGYTGALPGKLDLTGVRGIADSAFYGCTGLDELRLPVSFKARSPGFGIPDECRVVFCGFVDLEVVSPAGHPAPAGKRRMYCDGSTVSCSVEPVAADDDNPHLRYVCTGWSGTGSVPATGSGTDVTFVLDEDSTLKWNWETQALVSVSAAGDGSCPFGSQWLRMGETVAATVVPDDSPFELTFLGDMDGVVTNGTTLSFAVDRPRHVIAVVRTRGWWLDVSSAHGDAFPAPGRTSWPKGTSVSAFVANPEPADSVQYACSGWRGTGSVPASGSATNVSFVVSADSSLAWAWTTNYWIECSVAGAASSSFAPGWFRRGSTVSVPFSLSSGSSAYRLSGDTNGVSVDLSNRRISIPADGPHRIRAEFLGPDQAAVLSNEGTAVSVSPSGDASWTSVAESSASDGRCLRSGVVEAGATSVFETSVSGAGFLSFRWKVSGNRGDWVRFFADGSEKDSITRDEDWTGVSLELGNGDHVLRWSWEKSASAAAGGNGAFLDDLCWKPYVWLDVQSAFGEASPGVGSTRFVYGTRVDASVSEPAPADGTRRVCTGWTASGNAPSRGTGPEASFSILDDTTLVWNWRTDHWIDVSVSGTGSTAFAPRWIPHGAFATVEIEPASHLFEISLSGDTDGAVLSGTTLSVPSDRPRSISVLVREIKRSLVVESAYGVATPAVGRHDVSWGTLVAASVAEPEPSGGHQYVCTGWTGTGDVPASGAGRNVVFTAFGNSSLVWKWRENVRQSLAVTGPLAASFDEAWLERGTRNLVYYEPLAERYSLSLSGDTSGVVWDREARTLDIPADRPRDLALDLRVLTLAAALDANGFVWTTAGDAPWIPVEDRYAENGAAARSGAVCSYNESILATTVSGPGTLSWRWKLEGDDQAGVDVELDGRYVLYLSKPCNWTSASIDVAGSGEHLVRFVFWNAATESAADADRASIDGVSWTGAAPPGAATKTTEVPVPHVWLAGHAPSILAANGGNYESAANAIAANGRTVWECFVADLDPEDPTSEFRVGISVSNGLPVVTYDPDLGDARVYEVDGRETLDSGDWGPATDLSRFFRARVSLPDDWSPSGAVDGFPETVTISFDPNGGTVNPSTRTYTAPGLLGALPTPAKPGHSFLGWYSRNRDGVLFSSGSRVPWENFTLYARYGFYTLGFDPNGGEGTMPDRTCTFDETAVVPDCGFSRVGYDFAGWSLSAGSQPDFAPGEEFCNLAEQAGSTVLLHALWSPHSYTVRFDANGGEGTMTDQSFVYDSPGALSTNAFVRTGFTFVGWGTNLAGRVSFADGETVSNLASGSGAVATLYAQWLMGTSTVVRSGGLSVRYYDIASSGYSTWTQSEAAMTNYFASQTPTIATNSLDWGEGVDAGFSGNIGSTGDQWVSSGLTRPSSSSCRFHGKYSAGGTDHFAVFVSGVLEIAEPGLYQFAAVADDSVVLYIDGAARLGNEEGWVNVATSETVLTAGLHSISVGFYESTGGQGLSVQWKKPGDSSYSPIPQSVLLPDDEIVIPIIRISFDANGGEGNAPTDIVASPGASVTLPANPFVRAGYVFRGWAGLPDGEPVFRPGDEVAFDACATLYASWARIEYTVHFEANGGTGEMPDYSYNYDMGATTIPSLSFSKTGHSFVGWATAPDAVVAFADREPVRNVFADRDETEVTLCAVWLVNRYTVSFNSAGGSSVGSITENYGAVVTQPDDPTWTGHAFDGWSPAVPATMPPSNVVCTAQWTPNRYTIHFDANGGTGEMSDLECLYDEGSPGFGGLSVRYYDISSSGHSTWTQSESAMTNYFAGLTPTIVTNTADWGESLQSGFQGNVSSYFQDYPGLWLDNVSTNRYHGKYANSSQDYFSMLFEGELVISQAGTYSFAVSCDNAIVLYIDGTKVLSFQWPTSNGQPRSATSSLTLALGKHRISIATYESTGGQGMFVEWKKPGDTEWSPLPQSVLCSGIPIPGTVLPEVAFSGPNGAAFLGWSTTSDGLVEFADAERISNLSSVDGDVVTLYAKWRIPYTVHFDSNGGTGAMPDQVFVLDVPQNLATNSFAKQCCVFAGWATNETGDAIYGDGATVLNLGAAGTLWAVWVSPPQYMVVDLSSGANATSYSVTYLAEPPEGGFNTDEYKTTKLVLRCLEPGPIPTRNATITKPFYVGLFEMTQKQWELVMGSNPSSFSGDTRPVERVSYNDLRGSSLGAQWPASNAVDFDSFLGKLRVRTGIDFDLPTEAQWEYACRAGTTTKYSYGNSADGNYMWYKDNSSSQSHEVGTKLPNAWGLYDMHGNALEWCLDRFQYGASLSGNDPVGPSSGLGRAARGGYWGNSASFCGTSDRDNYDPSGSDYNGGFRLVGALSEEYRMNMDRTISFDSAGGSAVASITAVYGSALPLPTAPTKDGYDFAGWSPAFPSTMPLGGATLTAQWTPKNYTISFDTVNGSSVASITAAYGAVLTEPAAPTKDGYDFVGWSPAFPATMPLGGATLKALWTPKNATAYVVVDLSGGSSATSYAVTYLAEPPSGGFCTDEYKTTKLVLRRLHPGLIPTHDATITKSFYVGLFEVTQKQWELVMGSNPSSFSGDMRPVECVTYNAIRGSSLGSQWPSSNAVDSDSFLGRLRARTGLDFDLPTEAQWEYACRAGTTTTYSYGDSADGAYMWYWDNSPSQTQEVGTKRPNAWGLYDMHGNVWEMCLDWSGGSLSGNDPVGSSSGWGRVFRGGSWSISANQCTSSCRLGDGINPSFGRNDFGFRLVRTLSD